MKTTYSHKYRKPGLLIKQDCLPRLRHIPDDYIIKSAAIVEAGTGLVDGQNVEYQVIKVVLKKGVVS